MTRCCPEPTCRRSSPLLIRRGDLSGRWFLLTRYKTLGPEGAAVQAVERHDVSQQVQDHVIGAVLQDCLDAGLDQATLDVVAEKYGLSRTASGKPSAPGGGS